MADKYIWLSGGTTWTIPTDWNNGNYDIYCIGAGANGTLSNCGSPTAGGGGAFARLNSASGVVFSGSVAYVVGQGGTNGGATYFGGSSSTAPVYAPGGNAGPSGPGGAAASCKGGGASHGTNPGAPYAYSGGAGAAASGCALPQANGANGGGAAGPSGPGNASGTGQANNNLVAAATSGTTWACTNVWNGSVYTGATPSVGPGGGGSWSLGCTSSTSAAGNYGGGGSGAYVGPIGGTAGLIVIRYTPTQLVPWTPVAQLGPILAQFVGVAWREIRKLFPVLDAPRRPPLWAPSFARETS